jgi:predicted O-methyltransferase YrrM
VRVAPGDAADLRVPVEDGEEWLRVEQAEGVESCRLHAHRRMVQAHERVAVAVRLERGLEPRELPRAEPALAVVRLGEPRVEHDDDPAAQNPHAAHLEGRVGQSPFELVGDIVVAGDQQHRCAEVVEGQLEAAVGFGVVLHEVAGDGDRVGGQVAAARQRKAGLEAWQRAHAAQAGAGVRHQVGVGELQQSDHSRHRTSHGRSRATIVQCRAAIFPARAAGNAKSTDVAYSRGMSRRSISLTDSLYDYLLSVSLREPDLLRKLREETATDPSARMQISPEQGQFMALLARLMGARRCLEIGVFTGYSSLAVALALPDDGRILACDVSERWTAVARRYWAAAGVAHKVELRLAAALETIEQLLGSGAAGTFDFAFIDADKENYVGYYERVLELLRPGGLIVVDNTLWSGRVADPENAEADTVAMRHFNEHLHRDERVDLSLVPIGDGLTLARKR